jgi:hypothetical protein
MHKREALDTRLQMARMHDSMVDKLEKAMELGEYVEASWLCYAIFEQRVTRIIQKHIHKCPKQHRSSKSKTVGISTRLDCIVKLSKQGYGGYALIDYTVFSQIKKWCRRRNVLVHSLLDISSYKKYDTAFQELATEGYKLVPLVYEEATKIRNWCNENHTFPKFPEIKCSCKNQRCICEET